MKLFLSIAAFLAWLFGMMLLLAPGALYRQTGLLLTPMVATLAQAHGATLFGMGIILWLSREATGKGLIAVLAGNLVVQLLSLLVIARTAYLGAGLAVVPDGFIHVVLGGFFLYYLMRAKGLGATAA